MTEMNQYTSLIDNRFESFIEDFKNIINVPSVYVEDTSEHPFGKGVQVALETMLEISEKLGFSTYIDPDGYYGYAEIGSGKEMIGVLGHLDVVPAGDMEKWLTDPFQAVIKDGNMYGRGTQDDKGPTLAAMYALKAVMDAEIELNKTVRFIFGTDEELLWRGIAKYTEKERMPDYGFTPDANFPLIYAEKGLLQVDFISELPAGISFSGGDAYNAVPSSASYTCADEKEFNALKEIVESLDYTYKSSENTVSIVGKSVHAKDSEKGINAIARLCIALKELGKTSKTIEFIVNEIAEDALAEKVFGVCSDEASGALKFNIGKVLVTENSELINIDIRIPVTVDKEFVWTKLEALTKTYGFELKENDYLKSIYTPLDSPLVQTLLSAYQEVSGDTRTEAKSSGGATYARAMDNCVAYGAAFPTTKETEHQPNEFINLEELKVAMNIYATAFTKLLKTEII